MKIAAVLVLVGACGFAKLPKLGGGDAGGDAPSDTTAPDAGACMAASAECASSSTLRTCSAAGATAVDTTCSWGCLPNGTAHCGLLAPTGGGVVASDTDPQSLDMLGDVTLTGTLNGDTGAIGSIRGAGTGVISGIDYKLSSSGVAVFRMKSATFSGNLQISGSHAIAIVTDTSLTVGGIIDARGVCGANVSPGGFPGGVINASGQGPGGGSRSGGTDGAGGGGYGFPGGKGGGPNNTPGGIVYGDAAVTALVGGSGGGGGNINGAFGGHGGGAIQLVSNHVLMIPSGGGINAGGCGGRPPQGSGTNGGGGGGAGGTIVLEAASVQLIGSLAVNGGGGAGGDTAAGPGFDATLDRNSAAGGTSQNSGVGGNGGAGPSPVGGNGQPDIFVQAGGGGGGGIGRIRVNTQAGTVDADANAIFSPDPADAGTTFTVGHAQVQ